MLFQTCLGLLLNETFGLDIKTNFKRKQTENYVYKHNSMTRSKNSIIISWNTRKILRLLRDIALVVFLKAMQDNFWIGSSTNPLEKNSVDIHSNCITISSWLPVRFPLNGRTFKISLLLHLILRRFLLRLYILQSSFWLLCADLPRSSDSQ